LKFFKVDSYVPGSPLPELNAEPTLTSAITGAQKGGVTEVSNIQAQGKAAFVVVTNIIAPRDSQYAEVEADVQQKYTATESSRLAQDAAKSALERARKGESLQAIAKGYGLTVKTAAPFTIDGAAEGIGSATLLESAFKAKAGDAIGPIAAQGGEFICKVTTKTEADMSQYAANRDSIVQGLQSQKQSIQEPLFRDSVVSELKRRGKIKLNQDAINRMVGSFQS
jgi:peptidyl-prolyl cis-trans isomerase D